MARRTKLIVALHGAGMHTGVWGGMIGALTVPCQAVSFPGHGRAEGELLPSIEKMAEWAGTKLADHPPRSVALMGHSMGALAALAAARHPAVSALVLLGAAARMPVHPELLYQAGESPETATDMILKWGVSPVHPLAGAVRGMLREQMKTVAAGALLNDLKACNAYQGGEAAARAVAVPALVIAGMDDKLTRPEAGKALAEMMLAAQFHAFPDCGHMAMAEKPAETAADINAFLEGLEA